MSEFLMLTRGDDKTDDFSYQDEHVELESELGEYGGDDDDDEDDFEDEDESSSGGPSAEEDDEDLEDDEQAGKGGGGASGAAGVTEADSDEDPPVRDLVHRGDRLREHDRIVLRDQRDVRPEPDRPGHRRGG